MTIQNQPFKSFEEQVEILKSRSLVFTSEEKAKEILARENYYNVINGYKHLFIDYTSIDEKYIDNCTFEEIYTLYDFDKVIRNIVFKAILQSQLLRPTANTLEVGACNCPVVERLTPPTFSRLV